MQHFPPAYSTTQRNIICIFSLLVLNTPALLAQESDSIPLPAPRNLKFKQFAIPLGLTAYGIFAMGNHELVKLDQQIKEEVWVEEPHQRRSFDNYLQYGIGFSVFGLRAMGIKGKNSFRDEAMLYLLSNAIMGAVVNPMKRITRLQRPDGYGHNAFPSGHTATAFVGAEFLYQEYKDISPWYGVAGYAMATTVGYMRIYNNKHWMRDVIAGAGIGIASTKLAYMIYPSKLPIRIGHICGYRRELTLMQRPYSSEK